MTRQEATQFLRDGLNKHGLQDWSVRLNHNADSRFLGLCSHKDKTIILSSHHVDIHPTPDVVNTIWHEIAHALTPGHGHDQTWADKAREIGCDNTLPCSNLSLAPHIIDAIRSGADVEVTFEEQVIRTPKFTVTRLQDKCEQCGKVAKTKIESIIPAKKEDQPDLKIITLECGHIILKNIPKGTPFHLFQMGGDPMCKHVWDKNNCKVCDRKRPYPFQLEGMKFLESALATGSGGAIFDAMGLGKTIQAGGVIKFAIEKKECKACVWVLKATTIYQTASFIIRWMGDLHTPQIITSSKDTLIKGVKNYIISYDMMVPKSRTLKNGKTINSGFDIKKFDEVGVTHVILDECQQIKNVDSTRTQMVRKLVKGKKVIGLSGTPWKNRGSELFPILNMIDPMKFNSEEGFRRRWVATYNQGPHVKEGGIKNVAAFKEYTKDLCLRREQEDVLPELPAINRTKLVVKMDVDQEKIYDEAVDEFVKWYESQAADLSGMAIIAAMQRMRHIAAVAKVPATVEYVDEFIEETDRKITIFTHHIAAQELIYTEMKEKHGFEIPILKITSEMSGEAKYDAQERFNKAPRAILVASMLSAGEGLNLQTCSDCLMHERQWNPANEEQCEKRFSRIGSTASIVNAVYAHLDGLTTIDPDMDRIVERKRHQFADWTGSEAPPWNQDEIMRELADSIVRAHKIKKGRAA